MTETRRIIASALDGGPLEVVSRGAGPGVVLVEGGGVDDTVYRRLAERLAEHVEIHVYNRRGRGRSAAKPAGYGLGTEIADLGSLLAETGSTRVIGHSVGGFFALAAARELPIERLALYDPAVSVDGSFPSDFLDEWEGLVDTDPVEAMLVAARGLRNPGADLPAPIQRALLRLILRTGPGRTMVQLMPTVPPESRLAVQADGPASQWAAVTATTRFSIGARSPDYYLPTVRQIAAVMPDASVEVIPRQGHDALARAPQPLVESLAAFLLG